MKTKHSNIVYIALLLFFSSNLFSQDNIFKTIEEATKDGFVIESYIEDNIDIVSNELFGVSEEFRETYELEDQNTQEVAAVFARTLLALGAGIGFGNDDTLWCLHAAYYLRAAMFSSTALYVSLGVLYSGLSNDSFSRSFLELQFRALMFTPITRYKQVNFIYGLLLAYAFGADSFDSGGKTDFTRLTLALVVGFQIILTSTLSLMLQTNVLAHIRDTFKPESGGEFKDNNTRGYINKNNLLVLSLVWNLGGANR